MGFPLPINPGRIRLPRWATVDNRFVCLGMAVVITGAALGVTLAFPAAPEHPYYFFLGAIALATWFGGWEAGLVSTGLSAVLALVFVDLPRTAAMAQPFYLARYLGFLATSALVYGLAAALHNKVTQLRTAGLRFGGVVQISEDAIMTIDEEQNITLFNPGAEKIFGYRADEVLGKPIHLLLPERYRHLHAAHVRQFGASSDALRAMNERGTIYGLRKDGTEFPAEASISQYQADGVKIMTVRLRDISERELAERGLRQLAAIVESSQDAIIGEDLNGYIKSWNPGAERMYGYTAEETVGRDARMLLAPGASDEVSVNVEHARQGISSTYETVRVRQGGKRIEVALTVSPIRNKAGEVTGVSTIARDITERRRLEEQLRHSQKMEAVGRLAGGVAHDFNNLLSIIIGHAYLLQSSSSDGEPMRFAADQIMSAAERASGLTRQLLAFSRKQVLRPEIIDLNNITASLGKILPRLIGEDISLRIVPGANLRHIKADPGQLEQVIMNLVVNARDAMPNGGKLTIETANIYFDEAEARHHNVEPGDYVLLAVSDTGHGMDEQTRARIFEPFFTTKEPGKGTGLGLATVYGIVSQSNGYIWVYSEPGQGTTFKIYFPVVTAAVPAARAAHGPELKVCGTETVLLVEDETGLRELLTHVLENQGYKVISAARGPDALREVAQYEGAIHLLLTDVIMPDMRGQELAEQLQRRYADMSVIYMSGYTDNALIHSGSMPPGTRFLQKPFTPDVVLRRVREVLDEATQRGQRQRKAV